MKRRTGALLREALVYVRWATLPRHGPSLVFFPSHDRHVGSSNLRAYHACAHLRGLGWRAVVVSPNLKLSQRRRLLAVLRPDAVVLQKARHPDNRPQLYAGIPCLFDLDDADFLDAPSRAGIIECVQGSALTMAGSEMVADWCRSRHGRAEVVWTGSPVSAGPRRPQRGRQPILVWGASTPNTYPAEAEFLQAVIRLVSSRIGCVSLKLYANNGSQQYKGLVKDFEACGAAVLAMPYLAYDDYLASLDECAIGLAPLIDIDGYSGGKSFGKVLAYLDRGVPVLTHPVVDHPRFFRHGENGLMAQSAEEWAEHVVRLLADADERQRLAENGMASFRSALSMEVMARKMDWLLRQAIAAHGGYADTQA